MATLIVFPDAHPESTSVDGYTRHTTFSSPYLTWADLIAAAGLSAVDTEEWTSLVLIQAAPTPNTDKWRVLNRSILLFDTSGLPDGAPILSATLSIHGSEKADYLGIAPDINVYGSAPASDTGLVAGDYDSLGNTPFCDTPITYASWQANGTAGWNDFILNSDGIATISRTGITKLGLRNANYDVAGSAPAWTSILSTYMRGYLAEDSGGRKPRLVITYGSNEGHGVIAVVETRFHYVDAYGNERYIEGTTI